MTTPPNATEELLPIDFQMSAIRIGMSLAAITTKGEEEGQQFDLLAIELHKAYGEGLAAGRVALAPALPSEDDVKKLAMIYQAAWLEADKDQSTTADDNNESGVRAVLSALRPAPVAPEAMPEEPPAWFFLSLARYVRASVHDDVGLWADIRRNLSPTLSPSRDELVRELAREERAHEQTIDERDEAQEAISQAYYLVTGQSPEWRGGTAPGLGWGYKECLEEIGDALTILKANIAPASDRDELVRDAERWRALMSSQRMHLMGCAGFKFLPSGTGDESLATHILAVKEPGVPLRFGMEFWSAHAAHNDPAFPDQFERGLLTLYADELRCRALAPAAAPGDGGRFDSAGLRGANKEARKGQERLRNILSASYAAKPPKVTR